MTDPNPNELLEALVEKLNRDVSPIWGKTFPASKRGYSRLQRLISDHGYGAVRRSLEYAYDMKIRPKNTSAFPLMRTLCRGRESADGDVSRTP